MCGISGVLSDKENNSIDIKRTAAIMSSILSHRGPDDSGLWVNPENICSMSHSRLAIIDLSSAGHQPMSSKCGRYTIVFNGEIYNHHHLKGELEKSKLSNSSWKGHSDTEILLEAIRVWGLKKALQKSNGMFAIALWDHKKKRLSLARDRLGEKPLYFGWVNRNFAFASELKAFHAFPEFSNQIDKNALNLFLQYSYVPAPYSIYKDIYKLEPGTILSLSREDSQSALKQLPVAPFNWGSINIEKYWALDSIAAAGQSNLILDEENAMEELERILIDSIKLQSISDVPIGAFLSGGTDSSLIAALMQKHHSNPINTFSIGFNESSFNEAIHAKEVAQFLGTNHHEFYVSDNEARDVIPLLSSIYSEPFADSSQIPTFLVSKLARSSVTVALTGDAGDELFGGYNRYSLGSDLWKKFNFLPFSIRQMLGASLEKIPPQKLDQFLKVFPWFKGINLLGDKVHKFSRSMQHSQSLDEMYRSLTMDDSFFKSSLTGNTNLPSLINRYPEISQLIDPEHRMMAWDSLSYLTDDILCKVDRASMSVGLETRVPMLDYRLVELAWKLPLNMKIRNGQSKWILKELLYRHVPKKMIDRPKAGFSIPLDQWLRGPLRDWAEDLLDEQKLKSHENIDPTLIISGWKQHLSGSKDWSKSLWNILMFLSWQDFEKNNHSIHK
jgi:asparagine synthase (glutamine-hydrolysing)